MRPRLPIVTPMQQICIAQLHSDVERDVRAQEEFHVGGHLHGGVQSLREPLLLAVLELLLPPVLSAAISVLHSPASRGRTEIRDLEKKTHCDSSPMLARGARPAVVRDARSHTPSDAP